MEYLTNWTDTTLVKQSGWSGGAVFDNDLIFTATNGWRTFGWDIDDIVNKNITFEFDYKVVVNDNWSSTKMFITNLDTIAYGSSLKTLEDNLDTWTHVKYKINSAKKFIGINVRGSDNTGKSIIVHTRNIRIYDTDDSNKVKINKQGVLTSGTFLENKINPFISKDEIVADNFYEI